MKDRLAKICRVVAWCFAVPGLLLVIGPFCGDILNPVIYDTHGEYRYDGTIRTLLLQADEVRELGYIAGLPLSLIGMAGLIVFYGRKSLRFAVLRSRPFTFAALADIALVHGFVLAFMAPFFLLPAGSHIRPMQLPVFLGFVALASLIVIEPISVVATIKEKPRFLGLAGLLGGITPAFFCLMLLYLAIKLNGLQVSD
jgi:hypothetical protein